MKGKPIAPFQRPVGRTVSADEIVAAVVAEAGCGEFFFGKSRGPDEVLARGVAAVLIRELTDLSFPDIAEVMEKTNHSSVITAINRIKREIGKGGRAAEVYQRVGRMFAGTGSGS